MKKLKNKSIIIISAILLVLVVALTVPHDLLDATDVKDYSDTAKFFAGEYQAKHRAAHSVLYGLLLSPYVKIVDSFFLVKLASVFWLILVIISVYFISGRDRRALMFIVLSPVLWYMAPWLSPVPIVSLLFLWAYYFLDKFEKLGKIKHVIYAGLLIGLASSVWDSALYFSFIFLIAFFYDKKFYAVWIFLISIFVGLLPRLIVDQIFFGFAFYGILKNFFALLSFALYGGVYEGIYSVFGFGGYIVLLIFIPYYFYFLYKKELFAKYKKTLLFLTLCLLFILLNPHIRMIMVLMPIMILLLAKELNATQYKRQLFFFALLTLLVISPYLVQFHYETNARNFEKFLFKFPNITLDDSFRGELIRQDLAFIEKDFPRGGFIIGNGRDDYKELAHFYWGKNIEEFISIEDYHLFLENTDVIATKRISSDSDPRFRTEMWIEVGLGKNSNDDTDYASLEYALSVDEDLDLPDFKLVKKYNVLSVYKKA